MTDVVKLQPYDGVWPEHDPDANFKAEVAAYTQTDPMPTFEQLSRNTGIPVGALVRYVLVKWAAEGSEALLVMGPRLVRRMWSVVEDAEAAGDDASRLVAYTTLTQMLAWLRIPLGED